MARGSFTIIQLLIGERVAMLTDSMEHKKFRWGLGSAIANEWRNHTGQDTPRQMQPKTNAGTKCQAPHMIATYPMSFKPRALKILARFKTTRDSQGDLFDA